MLQFLPPLNENLIQIVHPKSSGVIVSVRKQQMEIDSFAVQPGGSSLVLKPLRSGVLGSRNQPVGVQRFRNSPELARLELLEFSSGRPDRRRGPVRARRHPPAGEAIFAQADNPGVWPVRKRAALHGPGLLNERDGIVFRIALRLDQTRTREPGKQRCRGDRPSSP